MRGCIGIAAAALLLVGCKVTATRPAAAPTTQSVDELAAAVAADSRRSDTETDANVRGQLAADANRDAQACLDRAPQAVACLYYHAIALGLEARAHPLHAGDALKSMLEALSRAEAVDPAFDQAGPARVKALVLIKAPAWPLGPGDPDAGLASARRAASLRPQYPANVLALAAALAKTGDVPGARENYLRARELAQGLAPSDDRDGWLREAQGALSKLPRTP
jgi:Flp pilus assembly protein TadD